MAEFSPAFGTVLNSTPQMTFVMSYNWGTFAAPAGGSTTTIVAVTPQATFVLRGFYATSGLYELWTGTSRNAPNPSGHPLTDITVIAELIGNGQF